MTMKTFLHERICNFFGKELDPNSDAQIEEALKTQLNIRLPQRPTMNDALSSSNSDHEVIELLLKYRSMP
ncbi:MAG: DNA polymerase I-like protein with 3'-5' exonuclease and polymerase domains [Oceanicoccus sp.]|jgi:DNA polymerase I-like protein with 3'-5' exonuclease and polymerase domains